MKFFIIAGEASGDVHGANLAKELLKLYPKASFYGTGGVNLKALGQKQYFTDRDMAIIGFVEVFKKLPFIFKMFSTIEKAIVEEKPDAVILIDYPGFNLRLAKKLKKYNIPVIYFVAPQFWVWHYSRIFTLKNYCHMVISIFPFEMPYFEKEGVNAYYVGNPIIDNFKFRFENKEEFLKETSFKGDRKIIGILPGSRKKEINLLMPAFMDAALEYDNIDFVISKADNIDKDLLMSYVKEKSNIKVLEKAQYDIMKYSDFIWACSGTVTLETAVMERPMIIVYSASKINVFLAKKLSNLRTIGLPNIMAGYEFLPEVHCIGEGSAKKELIITAYNKALDNLDNIKSELAKISQQFIGKTPSKTAAKLIYDLLENKK